MNRNVAIIVGAGNSALHGRLARAALHAGICLVEGPPTSGGATITLEKIEEKFKLSIMDACATVDSYYEAPTLRKTARERSHPNEPFYRKLSKRKQRW